jgi:hypothetical protein
METDFSRQAAMITDAAVFASLAPTQGDGRSRLLAALNHLNPPEDWFEEAAETYKGMVK